MAFLFCLKIVIPSEMNGDIKKLLFQLFC